MSTPTFKGTWPPEGWPEGWSSQPASTFVSTVLVGWTAAGPEHRGDQRLGQWVSNRLWDVRPDLADAIDGTERDPFYNDQRVDTCLAWVIEHWIDE